MVGSSLRLSYVGLPEQDMLDILLHYQDTQGIYFSFALPADTLSGLTTADYTLTGFSWRYAAPPTVLDLPCDRYTVEVELESVESKAALVSVGLRGRVGLSLLGGGAFVANGINAEIGLALNAGGAGGTGITESISLAFADNGAVGGSGSAGLNQTISLELAAGRAAAANGITEAVGITLLPGAASVFNPISYVGSGHATSPTQTAVAPTHEIGDLLIVVSSVAVSRPFPDLTGFTTLVDLQNVTNVSEGQIKVQYRLAESTSYTVTSWGDTGFGADQATIFVYNNADIGGLATDQATPRDYPALTFNNTDNTSWCIKILGEGSQNGFNTPASGFTMLRQQFFCVVSHSNAGVSSQAQEIVSGGNATCLGVTLELVSS
jgi:hypothetical protein